MSAVLTAVECPECAGIVGMLPNTLKGEILTCPDCGSELEVIALDPLALALAPRVEEDWGE